MLGWQVQGPVLAVVAGPDIDVGKWEVGPGDVAGDEGRDAGVDPGGQQRRLVRLNLQPPEVEFKDAGVRLPGPAEFVARDGEGDLVDEPVGPRPLGEVLDAGCLDHLPGQGMPEAFEVARELAEVVVGKRCIHRLSPFVVVLTDAHRPAAAASRRVKGMVRAGAQRQPGPLEAAGRTRGRRTPGWASPGQPGHEREPMATLVWEADLDRRGHKTKQHPSHGGRPRSAPPHGAIAAFSASSRP